MQCTKCGSAVQAENRFCPNCGASTQAAGLRKPVSFAEPDAAPVYWDSREKDRGDFSNPESSVPYTIDDAKKLRELFREETERTTKTNDARRWADASFIFGILSICFIAIGAGVLAIIFAFMFGIKSNRAADSIRIPREKKAKTGMILASVPLMIGVLAGIVVAILAICGVIG